MWSCICTCGTERRVKTQSLREGTSTSCGCSHRELTSKRFKGQTHTIKHGHARNQKSSPEYKSWGSMRHRCFNKNNISYKYYGGRGITVCERWNKFENFLKDMGRRPSKHSLERIDNNKGYGPENCRWATNLDQANNKRNNKYLTYKGKTRSRKEWARVLDISYSALLHRLNDLGWSTEKALGTPVKKYRRH